MKTKHNLLSSHLAGFRQLLISGLIASFTFAALAADVTWDTAPGTVGTGDSTITGGAGTWDTSIANWTVDAGANNILWNNAGNDTAIFGGTAGTVTLDADVTVGGLTMGNGYTIAPGTGPFGLTFGTAGDIAVASGTATITAAITSSNTITKTGNGTLRLFNDNNITGNLAINGGTLQLGDNNSIGSLNGASYAGDISFAGGATLFDKSNTTTTYSGVISGDGNLNKGGSGILTLTGANTYTGKTSILGSGGGGPGMSISSFNSVETNVALGTVHSASSSLGAPTTVANGTIAFGNAGNQRSSLLIYTGSGETTDRVMAVGFNSGSVHVLEQAGTGLLKFTSAFALNPSSGSTTSGLTLTGSGNGEIAAGMIASTTNGPIIPGILKKDGLGTWTLGGDTQANSVNVAAGSLIINGALTATTTVAVASGATLGGTGNVGGTVNVSGTINPGTSPGTLTFNDDLAMLANSIYAFEGGDLVDVVGELNLNSAWTLALGSGLVDGGSITIFEYGTLAGGTFTGPTFDDTNLGFTPTSSLSLTDTGTSFVLNGVSVIPEPSAALLSALGLLALLRRRR